MEGGDQTSPGLLSLSAGCIVRNSNRTKNCISNIKHHHAIRKAGADGVQQQVGSSNKGPPTRWSQAVSRGLGLQPQVANCKAVALGAVAFYCELISNNMRLKAKKKRGGGRLAG
jgi:hypothetical protein